MSLGGAKQPQSSTARLWNILAGATASIVLLLAIAVVARKMPDFAATGDGAAISLRTMDALRSRVLLGPYSQFGWNHPGPALFYVLAPLYFLTDFHEMSLRWSALIINLGSVGTMLLLLWRYGSPATVFTSAVALTALLLRPEGDLPFSVWNPLITLMPLALLIAIAAAIMSGRARSLPFFALIASFIVQTNIGYTLAVGVLAVATIGAWSVRAYRSTPEVRPQFRRSLNWTAWCVVFMWLLPLAEEVVNNPSGNVDETLRYFRGLPSVVQPIPEMLATFSHFFLGPLAIDYVTPVGHVGPQHVPAIEIVGALTLLVAIVGCGWLRRRNPFEAALLACCALGGFAGIWSLRQVPTASDDYQIFWCGVFGTLGLATVVATLLRSLVERVPHGRTGALAAGAIAIVAISGMSLKRMTDWASLMAADQSLFQLYSDLDRYAVSNGIDRPVLGSTQATWAETAGLVLLAAKRDRPVAVVDDLTHLVGSQFRATPGDRRVLRVYDVQRDKAEMAQGGRVIIQRGRFAIAETIRTP